VALTGLDCYKAVVAMRKTLKHDVSKRVLRKQEGGRAHKSDEPLFHEIFPKALNAAHCTTAVFGVDGLRRGAADRGEYCLPELLRNRAPRRIAANIAKPPKLLQPIKRKRPRV